MYTYIFKCLSMLKLNEYIFSLFGYMDLRIYLYFIWLHGINISLIFLNSSALVVEKNWSMVGHSHEKFDPRSVL